MIEIYHLFGDPALRVAKSDDPAGTGGTLGAGGTPGAGGSQGTGGASGGIDLTTTGCSAGQSKRVSPSALLLLLAVFLLLLRRRNGKRPTGS
jgi:MYXO-CTERM domain-containing protein